MDAAPGGLAITSWEKEVAARADAGRVASQQWRMMTSITGAKQPNSERPTGPSGVSGQARSGC